MLAIIRIIILFATNPLGGNSAISDAALLLQIILTVAVGFEAKRIGHRPALSGMYANLIYGVPQIIAAFFVHIPLSSLEAAIRKTNPNYSQSQVHQVAVAASAFVHAAGVLQILFYIGAGLFFGWIGSLFARKPQDQQAV